MCVCGVTASAEIEWQFGSSCSMIETEASSTTRGALLGTIAAVVAAFVLCYWNVLTKLLYDWANDDNYSHGFLIVPLALYLRLGATRGAGAAAALGRVASGWSSSSAAWPCSSRERSARSCSSAASRSSCSIAGAVLFVAGSRRLRMLAFPIAFLLLMVPPPAIIFNQIAFPLQLLALAVRRGDAAGVVDSRAA